MTKKITFTLPPQIVDNATSALLLGDFNNWDINSGSQMVAQKDGSLKATISLETGKTYQYRFLLNTGTWVNDDNAAEFIHQYQVQNCVITVPQNKVVAKKEIATTPKKPSAKKAKATKAVTEKVVTEKKVAAKKTATPKN